MEWRDQGVILSVRTHGESAAIIEVFTAEHGRHAGVVRGGASRRVAPVLQPGAQIEVTWRARLDDHIGAYAAEPLISRAGLMSDRRALAALNAVCALLRFALPEREPHPALYDATQDLLGRLAVTDDWSAGYLSWEMILLEELGYGLDLTACAVTGQTQDLAFVSPKTGRAVSRGGAGDWSDRLLPLPAVLSGTGPAAPGDIAAALATTGHFLARLAVDHGDKPVPEARARLVGLLARQVP